MVDEKEKTKVDHGRNVRTLRHWRKLSQDELADLLGDKIQCQISQLELRKTIDKKTLQEVADALKVDVEFLETFVPEELLEGHYFEVSNNQNQNKGGSAVIAGEYEDNSLPFSEMKKMFAEIRKQDKLIADMRCLLAKHGIDFDPDQK